VMAAICATFVQESNDEYGAHLVVHGKLLVPFDCVGVMLMQMTA
jgi:hypothetical protein